MISRLAYSVKQAFSQLGRNKAMNFTATLAITAMMLILGVFFVAFVNVDLSRRSSSRIIMSSRSISSMIIPSRAIRRSETRFRRWKVSARSRIARRRKRFRS